MKRKRIHDYLRDERMPDKPDHDAALAYALGVTQELPMPALDPFSAAYWLTVLARGYLDVIKDRRTDMDLYEDLVRNDVPTDNHESDLYFKATPKGLEILQRYPTMRASASYFKSDIDNETWVDVPFAYTPFWKEKGHG